MLCLVLRAEEPKHPPCRFKKSPCVPAPRAHVLPHAGVVPVHTGTFWICTRGVSSMSPHTPHTHTTTTAAATTHHNTRRQTETEKEDRERERQENYSTRKTREGKTRDKRQDQEKRRQDQEKRGEDQEKGREDQERYDVSCVWLCGFDSSCFLFSKLPDPRIFLVFNITITTLKAIKISRSFLVCQNCKLKLFSNYFGNHFPSFLTSPPVVLNEISNIWGDQSLDDGKAEGEPLPCYRFPLEDYIWWVSQGHVYSGKDRKKQRTWWWQWHAATSTTGRTWTDSWSYRTVRILARRRCFDLTHRRRVRAWILFKLVETTWWTRSSTARSSRTGSKSRMS